MTKINLKNVPFTDEQLVAIGFEVGEYLIFGYETEEKLNRNHYHYKERDVICKSCKTTLCKQKMWTDFFEKWEYTAGYELFKHCPYCGAKIK